MKHDTTAARAAARKPREVFPVSLDDEYWGKLAHKHGKRLPKHATPLTSTTLVPYIKKLGLTNKDFRDWTGNWSPRQFAEANAAKWNLRGIVGCLLELIEETSVRVARAQESP